MYQNEASYIIYGIATKEDIELAINTIRSTGNENITILKCTSVTLPL